MDDYYGHHAIRVPKIPISLIGFMGSLTEVVGYTIARFSGVNFVDLNRAVEHHAGCSVAQLVLEQGEPAYRRVETECLDRALRAQPPGVIALGEGALLQDEVRERVVGHSALVYLHHEAEDLAIRIRERQAQIPACFFPWFHDGQVCSSQVREMLATRSPHYEEAMLRLDATGRTPDSVAMEILDYFELTPTT